MPRVGSVATLVTICAGVLASSACLPSGTIGSFSTQCGGRGEVNATNGLGECVCIAGYSGSSCEECDIGYQDHDEDGTCLPSCPAQLSCSDLETCDDSSGQPVCVCLPGQQGEECQDCMPGYRDLDGDGTCDETCTLAALDCGPNGACDDSGDEAVCSCNPGFQDNDGDRICAPGCDEAQLACAHGTCSDASGTAVCVCEDGYADTLCDGCSAGFQDNDTDGTCLPDCTTADYACSGKGTCSDTSGVASCVCDDGYNPDGKGNCTTSLSYIVTAVNDGLDQEDLKLMDSGLSRRGYQREKKNTNVSRNELVQYLETPVTLLYHTGHGTDGAVATASSALTTSSVKIQAANTVFATCLTLTDGGWKAAFGPSAQRILGYTNLSYDITDNQVVTTVLEELDKGRDMLQAWYLANAGIRSLSDRWAAYVREGEKITEYSAKSGKEPKTFRSDTFAVVDAGGKVRAASSLLLDATAFVRSTNVLPHVGSETGTTHLTQALPGTAAKRLVPVSLSESESIRAAIEWLENTEGLPDDAELATVVHVDASGEDGSLAQVAHIVIFERTWAGYPIRSNGREHRLSVFVGDEGPFAATRFWPTLDADEGEAAPEVLLNAAEAVRSAAEQIGRALKSEDETVDLVGAEPVLGAVSRSSGDSTLRPAYDLASADGFHFIVDAVTGDLLP